MLLHGNCDTIDVSNVMQRVMLNVQGVAPEVALNNITFRSRSQDNFDKKNALPPK